MKGRGSPGRGGGLPGSPSLLSLPPSSGRHEPAVDGGRHLPLRRSLPRPPALRPLRLSGQVGWGGGPGAEAGNPELGGGPGAECGPGGGGSGSPGAGGGVGCVLELRGFPSRARWGRSRLPSMTLPPPPPLPRWQKIFKSRLVGLAVAYGNTVFIVLIVILVLLLFGGCRSHPPPRGRERSRGRLCWVDPPSPNRCPAGDP